MKLCRHSSLFAFASALAAVSFSQIQAADATWNGTTDATWATDTNRSATPVRGTGDIATFNNSGNANTTIDLGTASNSFVASRRVQQFIFNPADAATYTIGTGAADSQALTFDPSGSLSISPSGVEVQTLSARIRFGTTVNAEPSLFISNESLTHSLIITRSVPRTASTSDNGAARQGIVNVSGAENVEMARLFRHGTGAFGSMTLNKSGAGTLTLNGTVDNSNLVLGSLTAGTLVLDKVSGSGPRALGGATHQVNGGTLRLAGTGGDQIFDNRSVNVTTGGTFDLNGRSETINNLLGDATGNIRNTANSTTSTLTIGDLGRQAYFQSGSLQVVIIPEPNAAMLLGGLGSLILLRRGRSRATIG